MPPTDLTSPRDARAAGAARPAAVGAATAVRGQLAAREDVWIDGQLEGEVHAAGQQVTIGVAGRVRGEIRARLVIVEGQLEGEAHAEQLVVVRTGGRVRGDLRSPRVALDDRCWFSGSIDTTASIAPAAETPMGNAPELPTPAAGTAPEMPQPQTAPARPGGDG